MSEGHRKLRDILREFMRLAVNSVHREADAGNGADTGFHILDKSGCSSFPYSVCAQVYDIYFSSSLISIGSDSKINLTFPSISPDLSVNVVYITSSDWITSNLSRIS